MAQYLKHIGRHVLGICGDFLTRELINIHTQEQVFMIVIGPSSKRM